jgi:tetratricopeptide (TPR) repeat protein
MRRLLYILFLITVLPAVCIGNFQPGDPVLQLIAVKNPSFDTIDSVLQSIKKDADKLNEFIRKSEEVKYYEGLSYAYTSLGMIERNKTEYPKAIEYHNKGIFYAEKVDNRDFKVFGLNMLGVVYRRKDDVRRALELHKQALELAEKGETDTYNGLRNLSVSHNSIGNIYLTLKQPDLAEKEFLQSIKIEESIGNDLGLAINYQNLGGIYEELEELTKALSHYEKSLYYNNKINSELGQMICKNSIAQIYLKQDRPQKAYEMIQESLPVLDKIGDLYYIGLAKLNLGWALLELGQLDRSEVLLHESLRLGNERNIQYMIANSYKLLGELNEKKGNYKDALKFIRLFHENEEKYLNEKNQQYVADLIVKYDSDKKKSQIAILEKQNELANLKLKDNRKIFLIASLCFVLFGSLGYMLYRKNMISSEKEFLELEQKMMRSQMNPHFIFNSLNSIKLYIINNDKDKAVYYLNKFSKLIRTILSNSNERDITLKNELETMELYVSIENIRFSNKIRFSINIEEGIHTGHIRIPSLILQPFIENSIWHGLSSKEGDKLLGLTIRKAAERLLSIEIEDNGIGRERSAEIKSKKTLKNKSVGIDLTRERLANYFKASQRDFRLNIHDLVSPEGEAIGTQVVLEIPYS